MLYCKRRPSGASVWLLSSTDATPSDYGANTATAARTSTYRSQGYPEPGPLGPPESPYLLGAAVDLLNQAGTTTDDLARASRFTIEQIDNIVAAGSETKPRLRLVVEPTP